MVKQLLLGTSILPRLAKSPCKMGARYAASRRLNLACFSVLKQLFLAMVSAERLQAPSHNCDSGGFYSDYGGLVMVVWDGRTKHESRAFDVFFSD
jgi:hypothetical protein